MLSLSQIAGMGLGLSRRRGLGAGSQSIGMPASVASIVGFGDSITVGQNASTAANQWLNRVATALGAGTPLNQGIAGTILQNTADSGGSARTNNGRDRYVNDLCASSNLRAMVFPAYGFNDARYIAAPTTINVANYIVQYRQVIRGLIGAGYGPDRICIVSPYYISDAGLATGSTGFSGQSRSGFEAYVAASQQVANEFGTYWADAYSRMRDNGGASLISNDNIHPTDAGHQVIADAVMAAKRTPVSLPDYSSFGFMYDTFTDGAGMRLTAHSGERKSPWFAQNGVTNGAGMFVSSSGRLWAASTTEVYNCDCSPPNQDYGVEALFECLSVLSTDSIAITARASTSANTLYFANFSQAAGGFRLFSTKAGTNAQLGATVPATFTAGQAKKFRLEVTGAVTPVLKFYVDDALIINQTDASSPITAAGRPGLRIGGAVQSDTTGIQPTWIRAYAL